MRKRFLCILLVLCMLPIQSLAVNSGLGNVAYSSTVSSSVVSGGYDTGLALGIQTMKEEKYTVRRTEAEYKEGAAVNNQGLANAARHFLYSYPNPDTSSSSVASTVYILPMWRTGSQWKYPPKYMSGTSEGKLRRVSIEGHYYASELKSGVSSPHPIYQTMDMSISNYLYAAATSGKFAKDAGSDAYDYFDGYIEKMYLPIARDLVGYVFAPSKSISVVGQGTWYNVDVDTINKRWEDVYEYNIFNREGEEVKTQKICNYAALLLSLARLLPEENWDLYEQNISQFVVNAIRGEEYQPVLITAEMCQAYRHDSTKYYDAWMTVPEYLMFCAGITEEDKIRSADTRLGVKALGSGDINMAQTILKAARKDAGEKAGNQYGLGSMLGFDRYGKLNGLGEHCRAMTSLSDAAINSISNDWGLSVPNTAEALWGCGIFGGTEALIIKKDDVPEINASANATPKGSTDIHIDTSTLPTQAEQGSGQLTIPLTLEFNLGANYSYLKAETNGTVTMEKANLSGDSFGAYLNYYVGIRDHLEGYPDVDLEGEYPRIWIWLKGAVRNGTNLSDGSSLVTDTIGDLSDGSHLAARESNLGLTFNPKSLENAITTAFGEGVDVHTIPTDPTGFEISFKDYVPSAGEDKDKYSKPIVIKTDITMDYTLGGDDAAAEFWFKTGVSLYLVSPTYNDDGEYAGISVPRTVLYPNHKYAKYTLTAIPSPEKKAPTYKSTIAPAYSELKQGTPGHETFNSMTGTPTNTNGTYYQYFASGGSEFVVEFEAEYVENQTAQRTKIQKQREPVFG